MHSLISRRMSFKKICWLIRCLLLCRKMEVTITENVFLLSRLNYHDRNYTQRDIQCPSSDILFSSPKRPWMVLPNASGCISYQ
jgi:hypothetical protein